MDADKNYEGTFVVPLTRIVLHPAAARGDDDTDSLAALGWSMRSEAQLQPCVARPLSNGRFELFLGVRRYRAAAHVGIKAIRIERRHATDAEVLNLVVSETLTQRPRNPVEVAALVQHLTRPASKNGAGLSIDEVAKRFGKSIEWVRDRITLLRLPQAWLSRLASGELTELNVRTLLPYVDNVPVMRALSMGYERYPDHWQGQSDFRRIVVYVVRQFEKLNDVGEHPPRSRLVMSHRDTATQPGPRPAKVSPYLEERLDRQADVLSERLSGLLDDFLCEEEEPLTATGAEALLSAFWYAPDTLRLIAGVAIQRAQSQADEPGDG